MFLFQTDERAPVRREGEEKDFVEYQTNMTNALKEIARVSNDMVTCSFEMFAFWKT